VSTWNPFSLSAVLLFGELGSRIEFHVRYANTQDGEGSTLVLARHLIPDRVVRAPFFGKHRVQRFDRLVVTSHVCGPDELPEKLAPEHPVVIQLLAVAFELRTVLSA
jgi:hypothetical protein